MENKLRIYKIDKNFNLKSSKISNVAKEFKKEIDEYSGLKIKTTYINELNELVATKQFFIVRNGSRWEQQVIISFFDENDNIRATFRTSDVHNEEKQRKVKMSCMAQVFKRLLFDIDIEIKSNIEYINSLEIPQENKDLELAKVDDFKNGVNYLFENLLKKEVDNLLNRGIVEYLYNKIQEIDYPLLDIKATTSEEEVKLTYREICLKKFNPENFNFYKELEI